jgi:hypothetical protein
MESFVSNDFVQWLLCFALLAAAHEVGFRIRSRKIANINEAERTHFQALQNSIFGLMALLLAFMFAMAVSRYDMRKELVVRESNAIGTAYLRTAFAPEPQRGELKELLRLYVDARLGFYAARKNEHLREVEKTAFELQQKLWLKAVQLAQQDPRAVTWGLLVQSMNEVIDCDAKRLQALRNHIPQAVSIVLFFVSLLTFGFIGYAASFGNLRFWKSTSLVMATVALVQVIITDMDQPRRGLIKVDQESMLALKRQFQTTGISASIST